MGGNMTSGDHPPETTPKRRSGSRIGIIAPIFVVVVLAAIAAVVVIRPPGGEPPPHYNPSYNPSGQLERFVVTDEYIVAHFGSQTEILRYVTDAVDYQQKRFRRSAEHHYLWLELSQWLIAGLGALATIVVGYGNKEPKVAPWAIVPTALVTMITAISAFYNYRTEYLRTWTTFVELASLQTDVEYALIIAVGDSKDGAATIDKTYPSKWLDKLASIVGKANEEFSGEFRTGGAAPGKGGQPAAPPPKSP
jgi:hypothetical protein